MSKIVFLLMSCNNEFFQKEEELVKSTWLQPIVNHEYKDIDYYFYTSGETNKIEDHKIYVKSSDDWFATFYKTKLAFQALDDNNIEYDYVVRTNLSTYINVPLLLMFMKLHIEHISDNHIWGTDMLMHKNTPYMIGKFLIFPKSRIKEVLVCDTKFDTQVDADDYVFGCMFNDANIYKSIEPFYVYPAMYNMNETTHNILKPNFDWTSALQHLALSFKWYATSDYETRQVMEDKACRMLYERFKDHKPSVEDIAKLIHYNSNSVIDVDAHTIKEYKKECCILLFAVKGESFDKQYISDIVSAFKDTYDIYLVTNSKEATDFYYDMSDNYPFSIINVNDQSDYNLTLSLHYFWQRFLPFYVYAYVIKDIHQNYNVANIKNLIAHNHDIVGDNRSSLRMVASMYDFAKYLGPTEDDEWNRIYQYMQNAK